MGALIAEGTTNVGWTSDMISNVTSALNSAISNTLQTFVALLPIFATICGVAFGIRFVRGLFSQVKKGK